MVKSITMRSSLVISLCVLWLALPVVASHHSPPPVQPATLFAAFAAHAGEKVVIAAEPYDTQEKEAIFRVDYLAHGVLPIRIIVTNNSDRPINMEMARIAFITASDRKIVTAEPEDVKKLMSRPVSSGSLILPSDADSKIKFKSGMADIDSDYDTFEYRALEVPAHSTRAGFLFFGLSGLDHPLTGAHLQLRQLRDADGNELDYFEIPFDNYLKSQASQAN